MQCKSGDRVKVEYEATVVTSPSTFYPGRITLRRDGENRLINVPHEHVALVEPAYEIGELYRSQIGSVYEYQGGTGDTAWKLAKGNRCPGKYAVGRTFPFDLPNRPLVKLVPETTL